LPQRARVDDAVVVGRDPVTLLSGADLGPEAAGLIVWGIVVLVGVAIRGSTWSAPRHEEAVREALSLDDGARAERLADLDWQGQADA